jgi:hypothetical protein
LDGFGADWGVEVGGKFRVVAVIQSCQGRVDLMAGNPKERV